MSKKKKRIIISIVVAIVILVGVVSSLLYIKSKKKTETPVKEIEVLDSIKKYNYKLEDRDTEIYKQKFLELKEVLESEKIDEEKYATLIAELFAIDLYTIDNKNNKYDVGSLDFIYPEEQEKFKNKVTDSIYKLVEDNLTNNRKQELPIITKTEVTEINEIKYEKAGTKLNGYVIDLKLIYEKDLDYDEKIKVTVVEEENILYVVSVTSEQE